MPLSAVNGVSDYPQLNLALSNGFQSADTDNLFNPAKRYPTLGSGGSKGNC